MQNQRTTGAEPFGSVQDQDLLKTKPLSVQVPDVHESLKLAGVQDLKLSLDQSKSVRDKRTRLLCCCGDPRCGIGPMTQIEEVR